MSSLQPPYAAPTRNAPAMYRALVGIGVVCAGLIAGVHQWTAPVIAQNRAEFLRAAVLEVLPGAVSSASFGWTQRAGFVLEGARTPAQGRVHAGFDAAGTLVGVAIEAQGMGYQDTVAVLYGLDPRAQAIVGMRVLESRETPGLGDKIESDPQFLQNFVQLDVGLDASGQHLLHPLESVRRGEKTASFQIDAITGATISSQAITRILSESSRTWVPRIVAHVEELRAP